MPPTACPFPASRESRDRSRSCDAGVLARSIDVARLPSFGRGERSEGISRSTRASERKHGGWARAHSMPRNGATSDVLQVLPHGWVCGARASIRATLPRAGVARVAVDPPRLPWSPWGDSALAPRFVEVPVRPAPPTHERPIVSPIRVDSLGTGAGVAPRAAVGARGRRHMPGEEKRMNSSECTCRQSVARSGEANE
jgi:hypothetical protein